ncbi:MAG: sugar transferase [Terracidiphilus sp.]|jgi:lipopolysaccharide/colanic/teichoic acid biosynthesis glycosyltransferase
MVLDEIWADFFTYPVSFNATNPEKQAEDPDRENLSNWSRSSMKRIFDCFCVLCSLPIALPILFATGIAVRITSRGPVLFRQNRVGRGAKPFTIFKFRTMPVASSANLRPAVTTASNQILTPIRSFLRRWKLDELPQIFNVLSGDLSLVEPRPKLASHQLFPLLCRPGITGRATIAFAAEEEVLSSIPVAQLDAFYRDVVLPAKQELDSQYMSRATFISDLRLIYRSLTKKDDGRELRQLLSSSAPRHVACHRGTQLTSSRMRLQVLRRAGCRAGFRAVVPSGVRQGRTIDSATQSGRGF